MNKKNRTLKAMAAIMLMIVVAGCNKPDEPNNGGNNGGGNNGGSSGTINGHEYVDLGLPSGIWWATCNVGANTPEDLGDYFAWAEWETKFSYNWGTYKYCHDGDDHKLTKYCSNLDYGLGGFTDNSVQMEYVDDAAYKNWPGNSYGKMWRVPTFENWDELSDYCELVWTTRNGVKGMQFTGPNGKSIFLPAAGSRTDDSLDDVGEYGVYWTRSLYTEIPNRAWGFAFDSEECFFGAAERCDGQSVRPVIVSTTD